LQLQISQKFSPISSQFLPTRSQTRACQSDLIFLFYSPRRQSKTVSTPSVKSAFASICHWMRPTTSSGRGRFWLRLNCCSPPALST
uniref:Ovule protein n=1 Tax=Macrostomum lignano TaxID=282301 RepID=A0A1I8H6A2_9PLAT